MTEEDFTVEARSLFLAERFGVPVCRLLGVKISIAFLGAGA
jgi:hypothetical protein